MTFPYSGWVLMPSFKAKQEWFVQAYGDYSSKNDWHITGTGKNIHIGDIYSSKQAAIAAGRTLLFKQQADLDKKQANINKRQAALEKAAGEAKP